jgi:nitrite reductase (NADH) large subunit
MNAFLDRTALNGQTDFNGRTIAVPGVPDLDSAAQLMLRSGATVLRFIPENSGQDRFPHENWMMALLEDAFDDVVVLSAQGIRLLVELANQANHGNRLNRALLKVRRIAHGPRPAAALQELGISVDITCKDSKAETLRAALQELDLRGRVVGLIPRTNDPELISLIESRGGLPRMLTTSDQTDSSLTKVVGALSANTLDVLLFSTPEQVQAFWHTVSAQGVEQHLKGNGKLRVAAVGVATARCLEQCGLPVHALIPPSRFAFPQATQLAELLGLSSTGTSARERPDKAPADQHTVVVIGNGMVGHRFIDKLHALDTDKKYRIVTFCEEPRPAYDRVQLTKYFETRNPDSLQLADQDWYRERGVRLLLGERATRVDRQRRAVLSSSGEWIAYDHAVFCTGSLPFVPPIPGTNKQGVHVYRTIEDLEAIARQASSAKRAVVLGGGLLGLEAAKAAHDMGLETHVVEFAPRLMPRQLDEGAARLLALRIKELGVHIHLNRAVVQVQGEGSVTGIGFDDGSSLETDMLIISTGIRPRDDLARECGLTVGNRGGITVDDNLLTSDPNIFAIGECALHRNVVYGLVAPGYEMAEAVAKSLVRETTTFSGTDQSAKLKLLGVEVASLGDPFADNATTAGEKPARSIVFEDLVHGIYKKLVVSDDCKQLLGAILVGDTSEYASLLHFVRTQTELPPAPEQLILGTRDGSAGPAPLPDTAQVCSCNNVTRGDLCNAIREKSCTTFAELKACTKAGAGCGGCAPLVTDILQAELKASGKAVKKDLCEHFSFSRQELYQIVKINKLTTFEQLIASHGRGSGCEICKPAVASIFASVHNELILKHTTLQDTNDRYLANIQRGGTYSVVPRVAGGEITPEKLISLGQIAKKYNLYTKITGGQRIDMFGAQLGQLPDIWQELVEAGFESGHAYGKAVRTVKSCVGSTWCRFGVQDSVGFAIRVEERYKGIRAPHKLKSAVSGCVRECAEAQSKDFGLIATEKGYNLYVCGNGGAKPRHADLLATDLDENTALKYIDRFLMFYISTADRLTRTSVWLDKMEGGIDYLRDVVINDRLGICAQLEQDMQHLVDTYQCEWAKVVSDPALRAQFRHFANSTESDQVEFVIERGQRRPADWPKTPAAASNNGAAAKSEPRKVHLPVLDVSWVQVARVEDVPKDGGIAIKLGKTQIAVFNFASRGEWYATQNLCPHKQDMVLARGLVGDQANTPKVACPQHKKTFSLQTGECLSGDSLEIKTFPVKIQDGAVLVELPSVWVMEQVIPCSRARGHADSCDRPALNP